MKNYLLTLMLLFITFNAFSAIHHVNKNDNITNVINGAGSGDTLVFSPGKYEVNILLDNKNLTLRGLDTKNTILSPADNSKPIIEINGSSNSTIQNFTFYDANTGMLVVDSTVDLTIRNNVFRLGTNSTAIRIGEAVFSEIANNTFYGNAINLENGSATITVKNNIFADFNTLISGTLPNNVSFNCIDENLSNFSVGNTINTEATFVDIKTNENDFHLQDGSSCTDLSEGENDYDDAGAYGGNGFDKTPDAIAVASINKDDLSAIVVQWNESKDYQVSGYKVYYHTQAIYSASQAVYLTLDARNNALTVIDTEKTLSTTLNNLSVQTQQPIAPTLLSVLPGKNKLTPRWNSVDNATSYTVFYKTDNETAVSIDAGNVTSYQISGLNNDLLYTVWVEAKNQLSYYFQVAAYIENTGNEFAESYFTKEDEKLDIGDPVTSDISNKISIQPEAIVAYPVLPNEGCFIATAAFGFYSAEQVQVLRQFRDNHLLTNRVGQLFVAWYYHHGPYAASIIEKYTWLKPVTRALLYPLIVATDLFEKNLLGFFAFMSLFFALFFITLHKLFSASRRASI